MWGRGSADRRYALKRLELEGTKLVALLLRAHIEVMLLPQAPTFPARPSHSCGPSNGPLSRLRYAAALSYSSYSSSILQLSADAAYIITEGESTEASPVTCNTPPRRLDAISQSSH